MSNELLDVELDQVSAAQAVKVVLAKGDGIGPEIMDATLKILNAADAKIDPVFIEVGCYSCK